ncbi:hypothetical protein KKG45_10870 [bacterium]|nr:hypothetical protein [bacterium]MBU1073738.1 hypothetical protein [bacterium]MBU1674636.1 hypothetical protein [bacterium]
MKTRILILMIAAIAVTLPVAAQAQQLFDFLGQANLPAGQGGTLSMYSIVSNPVPATPPLPLDFDSFQYTLVIVDLVLDVDGDPQEYSGGTITIYEDAATAADYAFPGTFVDGTAILIGTFDYLNRSMFTATLGTASGQLDWTGGSMVDMIAPDDRLDWLFFTGINALASQVEPGYDEAWDGKVEPEHPIVPGEQMNWGEVKNAY